MKIRNFKSLVLAALVAITFSACSDDEGPAGVEIELEDSHVLVLNQGNFMSGNANISAYDKDSEEIITNVFSEVNLRPLGDVAQSAVAHNDAIYVVVNNSGKIEKVEMDDFSEEATITGFVSPRFMLPVGDDQAYVSDLSSGFVAVVDLEENAIIDSIETGDYTEQLVQRENDVLTNLPNQNAVAVILGGTVTSTISTPGFAVQMTQTEDGKTWVLCQTVQYDNSSLVLAQINPGSTTVDASYTFAGGTTFGTSIKSFENTLYILAGDLFKFGQGDDAPSLLVSGENKAFYSLGVDPSNEEIYLGDAVDYAQNGVIYRHSASGELISSFASGIIPGEFYFYE